MSERLLDLRGLTAGYGKLAVVHGLDLWVSAGEVVSLLGPNGAGKTTTVLTIAGLLKPIGGEVEVLGAPVRPPRFAHEMARRGLGVVPDDRGLFPRLTVRQHLEFVKGDSPIEHTLTFLPELRRLLNERVGVLSGGEQQMVALAKILVRRPKLLIVDEMSLGLAPIISSRLAQVVRTLASEEGLGVLLVEQHLDLALTVSDRAAVLEHGRLSFAGSATELRERPDTIEGLYLGESALD